MITPLRLFQALSGGLVRAHISTVYRALELPVCIPLGNENFLPPDSKFPDFLCDQSFAGADGKQGFAQAQIFTP
jgi:hypothetical protein